MFDGFLGVQEIQIGSKRIAVPQPKTLHTLMGYGDTLNVGDVFYETFYKDGKKFESGPYRFDGCSASADTWYRFTAPDGGKPFGNYQGSGWHRKFRLADKEISKKLTDALVFEGLYVRLYVSFLGPEDKRPTLIPASWIAWVGNLQKAFCEYRGPYGKLKKKNIVRWIDNGMFTDFSMKSKVPIPANFPINIEK